MGIANGGGVIETGTDAPVSYGGGSMGSGGYGVTNGDDSAYSSSSDDM